jgi:hypothetical protein
MNYLKKFFSGRFTLLEDAVIQALLSKLSGQVHQIVSNWIASVNLVQRHNSGREVLMYRMKRGVPDFDPELMIPSAPHGDCVVARIKYQVCNNSSEENEVEFICTRGYLFSMIFKRHPQKLDEGIQLNIVQVLLLPPLSSSINGQQPTELQLDGFVLPLDEFAFKAEHSDCGILPLQKSDMYTTVLDEYDYLVIAVIAEKGIIAVRRHDASKQLYFISYEQSIPTAVGGSLTRADELISKIVAQQ